MSHKNICCSLPPLCFLLVPCCCHELLLDDLALLSLQIQILGGKNSARAVEGSLCCPACWLGCLGQNTFTAQTLFSLSFHHTYLMTLSTLNRSLGRFLSAHFFCCSCFSLRFELSAIWGATPGCVHVVRHGYTQSSTGEEAVCWQGLEHSPFPLFFTPEGSSVQGLAVGAPLSPWSHTQCHSQSLPWCHWEGTDAVTEGSFLTGAKRL